MLQSLHQSGVVNMQSPDRSVIYKRLQHTHLEMCSVDNNESFCDKGPPMNILDMEEDREDRSMFERDNSANDI